MSSTLVRGARGISTVDRSNPPSPAITDQTALTSAALLHLLAQLVGEIVHPVIFSLEQGAFLSVTHEEEDRPLATLRIPRTRLDRNQLHAALGTVELDVVGEPFTRPAEDKTHRQRMQRILSSI